MTKVNKQKSVLARTDNGSIQLTFRLPWAEIEKSKKNVILEHAKDTVVKGFRKGKAPLDKVEEKIGKDHILDHALTQTIPPYFTKALNEHKINPIMYPKFELVSAEEGKDWEIRATTAEMPAFELGDYKKIIKNSKTKEGSEKESVIIDLLIKSIDLNIPNILVEQEVNERLSSLLSRIEKLGLTLESYLTSIKKTSEDLRVEYTESAIRSIKLDFILLAISKAENILVEDEEIEAFINAAKANSSLSQNLDKEDQKALVHTLLKKQKVITYLTNLV